MSTLSFKINETTHSFTSKSAVSQKLAQVREHKARLEASLRDLNKLEVELKKIS